VVSGALRRITGSSNSNPVAANCQQTPVKSTAEILVAAAMGPAKASPSGPMT
jgi:hypothetical protein